MSICPFITDGNDSGTSPSTLRTLWNKSYLLFLYGLSALNSCGLYCFSSAFFPHIKKCTNRSTGSLSASGLASRYAPGWKFSSVVSINNGMKRALSIGLSSRSADSGRHWGNPTQDRPSVGSSPYQSRSANWRFCPDGLMIVWDDVHRTSTRALKQARRPDRNPGSTGRCSRRRCRTSA